MLETKKDSSNLTANELDLKVSEMVRHYDIYSDMKYHELVGDGQKLELLDQSGKANRYYQYLACLMEVVKPKQIVELGAAAGISTTQMALHMPKDCHLYSVDNDPLIAWIWMNKEFPNLHKILGNDLNLSIYPKELDLSKTDVWFIDSLHMAEQIHEEMKLYSPFMKKGAIVLFDDVHVNPAFEKACEEIHAGKYLDFDWLDITIPNHYSGFAIAIVK